VSILISPERALTHIRKLMFTVPPPQVHIQPTAG
jgi:hypothetical protein